MDAGLKSDLLRLLPGLIRMASSGLPAFSARTDPTLREAEVLLERVRASRPSPARDDNVVRMD